MRLIDADALKAKIRDTAAEGTIADYCKRVMVECLDNDAPTIDAIPVEWLEEHDSEGNEFGRRYITVVEALSMWQKEQEAR